MLSQEGKGKTMDTSLLGRLEKYFMIHFIAIPMKKEPALIGVWLQFTVVRICSLALLWAVPLS